MAMRIPIVGAGTVAISYLDFIFVTFHPVFAIGCSAASRARGTTGETFDTVACRPLCPGVELSLEGRELSQSGMLGRLYWYA
jgi:hypothetical protein